MKNAQALPKISMIALVLLITGSIDSIRNLPTTALFGSELIFFFIFGAIVFLIPVALVSAELSSTWTDTEGGIYGWVRHAFGDNWAFFAIWLQWINTMVWYPTILSFLASIIAYLIDPDLAENKWYLVSVILIIYWGLTFINLRGLSISAKFASVCAVLGLIIPMLLIITLAILWMVQGKPMQIDLSWSALTPTWGEFDSWISITAIITSFLGMELATVHVNQVKNPQRNFPLAIFVSAILILTTMILGALAIAIVLPKQEISLVKGVMQSLTNFFEEYHLMWLLPVIALMLLIGSLGSMVNWIISPAKGMMLAARHGYLPRFFAKENRYGAASHLLLLQAVLVTVFCSLLFLIPSVNSAYWLLTDLSTELYVVMYVLMFAAAFHIRRKFPKLKRPFAIPGGQWGMGLVCFIGIVGCVIALIIGFYSPEGISVHNSYSYSQVFGFSMFMMLSPSLIFYGYRYWRAN